MSLRFNATALVHLKLRLITPVNTSAINGHYRPKTPKWIQRIATASNPSYSFRSTLHLTQIAPDLDERGVDLKVLDQSIDTSTPTGKLLVHVLASIAEFKTGIRTERQAEGIKKALDKGVKFGVKAKLSEEQVNELRRRRESGEKVKDLMGDYGINKATLYRLLSES